MKESYENLSFYTQNNKRVKILDPNFILWLISLTDHELDRSSAAYGICQQIINQNTLKNLSSAQKAVFVKYVLDEHIIKSTCPICQNTFDWEEQPFAENMPGYGIVHSYCKEKFETEL
ncbi:hypothetical protein KKD70_00055 [Patescibacteria group bacterium]|nr:hypothetical protein [Patescibacteria group bacterium]